MAIFFIGFSHSDGKEWATSLRKKLEELGHTCLIVEDDVIPGTLWEKYNEEAIERSHAAIFLVTNGFAKSEWCRKEVDFARSHNKSVIPIRVHSEAKMFLGLQGTQCLTFNDFLARIETSDIITFGTESKNHDDQNQPGANPRGERRPMAWRFVSCTLILVIFFAIIAFHVWNPAHEKQKFEKKDTGPFEKIIPKPIDPLIDPLTPIAPDYGRVEIPASDTESSFEPKVDVVKLNLTKIRRYIDGFRLDLAAEELKKLKRNTKFVPNSENAKEFLILEGEIALDSMRFSDAHKNFDDALVSFDSDPSTANELGKLLERAAAGIRGGDQGYPFENEKNDSTRIFFLECRCRDLIMKNQCDAALECLTRFTEREMEMDIDQLKLCAEAAARCSKMLPNQSGSRFAFLAVKLCNKMKERGLPEEFEAGRLYFASGHSSAWVQIQKILKLKPRRLNT